jgi:hypothetical protein
VTPAIPVVGGAGRTRVFPVYPPLCEWGIINRMNTQINIQFTVPICFSISAASSGEALGMTVYNHKLQINFEIHLLFLAYY